MSDLDPLTIEESIDRPAVQVTTSPRPDNADKGRRFHRKSNRISKWDRPPAAKDWRWWIGGLGKALISVGLLMFGFVAYQLWGTAIETARAQSSLESDFNEQLATVTAVSTVPVEQVQPTTTVSDPAVVQPGQPTTTLPAPLPPAEQNLPPTITEGDAIARLEIPTLGVDKIVVAGVSKADLKKGPGHYPDTPLPGQLGNSAIAGHRTTYGEPFRHIDELVPGDTIVVTTLTSSYTYVVTGQKIVSPNDYFVVTTTDPTVATLTLTTCDPPLSTTNRLVVSSVLDPTRSGPIGEPILNYGRETEPAIDETATATTIEPSTDTVVAVDPEVTATTENEATGTLTEPDDTAAIDGDASGTIGSDEGDARIADAFSDGWFSDPAANIQVAFWGLLLAAIGVGAYLLSKRFRHDSIGLLVGIVPFCVVLYFFFQNVNRLLPPNL